MIRNIHSGDRDLTPVLGPSVNISIPTHWIKNWPKDGGAATKQRIVGCVGCKSILNVENGRLTWQSLKCWHSLRMMKASLPLTQLLCSDCDNWESERSPSHELRQSKPRILTRGLKIRRFCYRIELLCIMGNRWEPRLVILVMSMDEESQIEIARGGCVVTWLIWVRTHSKLHPAATRRHDHLYEHLRWAYSMSLCE